MTEWGGQGVGSAFRELWLRVYDHDDSEPARYGGAFWLPRPIFFSFPPNPAIIPTYEQTPWPPSSFSRHPLRASAGRGLPQVGPDLAVDLRPGAALLGPQGPIPKRGLLAGAGFGPGPLRGAALLDRLRHPRLRPPAPDRRHRHPVRPGRVSLSLYRGLGAGGRLGRRPGPQPALVGAGPLGDPGDGADLHHQRLSLGVAGQRPLPLSPAAPTGRSHRGVRPVVPGGPGERQPLSPLLPAPGQGLARSARPRPSA